MTAGFDRDQVCTSKRDNIATHARTLFRDRGFQTVSVRGIAAAAGVDPALVLRHHGSKAEFFVRVIGFDDAFGPHIDGPVKTIGRRLVGYLLDPAHAELRRTSTTVLRAMGQEFVRIDLHSTIQRLLVAKLADRIGDPDAKLRAWLVSAQMVGLLQEWDAIADEAVEPEQRAGIADVCGAAVQALITG